MVSSGFTLLVLLSMSIAGCVKESHPPVAPDVDDIQPPEEGLNDDTSWPLVFPESGDVKMVQWSNGSYSPHESNFPIGFGVSTLTGENPADHLLEIQDHIPVGVPAMVELKLEWSPLAAGNLQLRIQAAEQTTVYSWHEEYTETSGSLRALLMRADGDPLKAGVRYNSPDAQADTDYVFRVSVIHDDTHIPAGVPVAVQITEEADVLSVHPIENVGADAAVLLWGPDDAFLGHFELDQNGAHINTTEFGRPGAYVLLTSGAGVSTAMLTGPTTEPNVLNSLKLEKVQGDVVEAEPTGTTSWPFTIDQRPLSVAIRLLESVMVTGIEGQVTGPEGMVFEFDNEGTLILSDWWWESAMGPKNLVLGDYEASWTNAASVGVRVAVETTYYSR